MSVSPVQCLSKKSGGGVGEKRKWPQVPQTPQMNCYLFNGNLFGVIMLFAYLPLIWVALSPRKTLQSK